MSKNQTLSKPTDDEQESGKGLGGTHCSASFVPTLPTEFGYYWVTKKPGEKPVMLHLCPSKQFRHDERSVEAWDCPGIGRSRLDILNMPRWMWVQVLPPNDKMIQPEGAKDL